MVQKKSDVIESVKNDGLEWVMVRKNDKKTLRRLSEDFEYHDLDLDDVAPPIQSVKFVARNEYLFLILQYPLLDKKTGVIKTAEIDFFIEKDRLVIIDINNLPQLQEIFLSFKSSAKKKSRSQPLVTDLPRLLHLIIDNLIMSIYPMMRGMTQDIERIEDRLFEDFNRGLIKEILRIKMNLVNTRKALQAHGDVFKKLVCEFEVRAKHSKHMHAYFQKLIDDTGDIWNLTELQQDTINALHETSASLSDYKINDIMKTLTIFSVIVFPLNLLAAIFGMNAINMPFVNHVYGFWIIVGMMMISSLGMLVFFKRKKWL